jgi:hypothetical protein
LPELDDSWLIADETSTVRNYSPGVGDKTLEGQMTRLRQIAMAGLAAIAIGGVASSASAMETGTFQNRLNGATIGLPLGAAPPPGLYTGLETAYLGVISSGSRSGQSAGNQCATTAAIRPGSCATLPAIAQAVPLLWVPGWNFLGATYSASVVQAFYWFTTCGANANGSCAGGAPFTSGGIVYTNTFIQPIALSWNLGGGWFISGAFSFDPPDGSRNGGQFTPNPDYWTFEPSVAFSYLGNNWVASANFFYDINTRSQSNCCSRLPITSGNALFGDFTAVYKFGKWSIGPVGYFETQTTNDTGPCNGLPATPGVNLCGRYQTAAAGGLIGYDFGPVDLQVWVTDSFVGQNTPQGSGGLNVWSRIGFKIWGPEAPPARPLVSKQ